MISRPLFNHVSNNILRLSCVHLAIKQIQCILNGDFFIFAKICIILNSKQHFSCTQIQSIITSCNTCSYKRIITYSDVVENIPKSFIKVMHSFIVIITFCDSVIVVPYLAFFKSKIPIWL